jgi:hypothetical protein
MSRTQRIGPRLATKACSLHTRNAESFERDLMSFSAPSKLYFIAGVLFLLAAAIDFSDRGLELKTVTGLLLASGMVALGLKAGNRKVV